MGSCGRTISKVNSSEDRAVLTIEEIQSVVEGKICEDLDCVDWHFSTENFKSFCPLGHRPISGGMDAEIKVASTVSSETSKVLQKWMDATYSGVSSRASGTMCVRHSSGKLKYRLSLKHILPLSASFEDHRDRKASRKPTAFRRWVRRAIFSCMKNSSLLSMHLCG